MYHPWRRSERGLALLESGEKDSLAGILDTSSRFGFYKSASSNKAHFYWDVLAASFASHNLSLLFSL